MNVTKRAISLSILSTLLFSLFASQVYAITIRCNFSGEITQVTGPASLSNEIFTGSQFYGGFVYDNESPVAGSPGANSTVYTGEAGYVSITFIGANGVHKITSGLSSGIMVTDSAILDEMYLHLEEWLDGSIAGISPDEASLSFKDFTGSTFSSMALPASLSSEAFDHKGIWIGNIGDPRNGFELSGKIDFLEAIPTPEPTVVTLIAFGGLVGLFYERKRSAKR